MLTLALVDDHPLFRAGLRSALSWQPGFLVVAEASDAESAILMVEQSRPDLLLLDLGLPGMTGVELGRELVLRRSKTRILALSGSTTDERIAEAFESGIMGYATKAQPIADLVDAILAVADGRRYLPPFFSAASVDAHRRRQAQSRLLQAELARLTARERQIFDLTVQGLHSESIGLQLGISRRTVDTHRSRVLTKLGAHSGMDLVRLAARLGLLEAPATEGGG
jgi:RNA polymerase sigma factor (sigma-70 family)